MNEAPFPSPTTVPRSLPPPAMRVPPTTRVSQLRASLVVCSREGAVAEMAGACFGNTVVAAWAIELGASPLLLGALWGLPFFGQVFQLPGAWVTARLGPKRAAVLLNAVSRQILLPAALLPFVSMPVDARRTILTTLFALSSLSGTVGNNAWLAWMADLVPGPVRGRYFGRRAAMCTATATLATLGVAVALDAGRSHHVPDVVLAALIVARSFFGGVTTLLMRRQHAPPHASVPPRVHDLALPWLDPVYRRLLVYRGAWGGATGLAASVSAAYLVESLGMGFTGLAGYGVLVAALRVLTAPLWGGALDRAGPRVVLIACTFGAALSSFFWIGATAGYLWMIAADALLSGILLGGQELAVFTLPLSAAPGAQRPLFVATSMAVGGVTYGLACAMGGALASASSPREVLVLSAVARVLASFTAVGLGEPGRRSGGTTGAPGRMTRSPSSPSGALTRIALGWPGVPQG